MCRKAHFIAEGNFISDSGLMFNYDKDLMRLWNNSLKYVPRYQTAAFAATPDFSVYPNMNYNELRYNVYKGRWLGKTWQNYGFKVIPTIPWATPDTYDLCFSGKEEGSAIIISTIGCQDNSAMFLEEFTNAISDADRYRTEFKYRIGTIILHKTKDNILRFAHDEIQTSLDEINALRL